MILKPYTKIEEMEEGEGDQPGISAEKLRFFPLKDLNTLQDQGQQIDIVVVVLDVSNVENRKRKSDSMEISFREMILTDSRQKTIIYKCVDEDINKSGEAGGK